MIVGVGELLWDVYPDGRKAAGGAPFNFAFHCHQLGHPAAIVSRVGADDLGRELREEVRRMGLGDEWIQTDRDHPTGTVTVSLDANKIPSFTIAENVAWDFMAIPGSLRSASGLTAVCFGTLALRSPVSCDSILDCVRGLSGALRVFDANIRPPAFPSPATLRQCFASAEWIKLSSDDLRNCPSLTDRVRSENPKVEIVTLGGEGCEIRKFDGSRFAVPTVSANVVDTVGAGDAFTAAMVCLHLEGRPLRDCARFANAYAARVCEHRGATPQLDRRDIERTVFG